MSRGKRAIGLVERDGSGCMSERSQTVIEMARRKRRRDIPGHAW